MSLDIKMTSEPITLGPMKFALYGEDENLTHDHRKSSSRPGRFILCQTKGEMKWSTNHEVGNRQLIREWEEEAHSFVRNWYTLLVTQAFDIDSLGLTAQCACYAAGKLILKRTNGGFTALTTPMDIGGAGACDAGYRGAAGKCDRGIQVGTGTNANSFEDAQLQTLVLEGCTSGKLSYVAMVDYTAGCDKPTYSSCTTKWTHLVSRFVNNNSGGTIGINEVGLVSATANPGGSFVMVARDKLCATVCVTDAGQLKVTYTMVSPAVA